MSLKSILLIVVLTAIVITLVLSLFTDSSGVEAFDVHGPGEDAFLESDRLTKVFDQEEKEVFLAVKVRNHDEKDVVKILVRQDGDIPYQESRILLEGKGSSVLTVSLLKINDRFIPGHYSAQVFFNERLSQEIGFQID